MALRIRHRPLLSPYAEVYCPNSAFSSIGPQELLPPSAEGPPSTGPRMPPSSLPYGQTSGTNAPNPAEEIRAGSGCWLPFNSPALSQAGMSEVSVTMRQARSSYAHHLVVSYFAIISIFEGTKKSFMGHCLGLLRRAPSIAALGCLQRGGPLRMFGSTP